MNETELAVRRAVEKTQRQSKLSAARFKVEQAQRNLDAHKAVVGDLRGKVEEAQKELDVIEAELKAPLVPKGPADPLSI